MSTPEVNEKLYLANANLYYRGMKWYAGILGLLIAYFWWATGAGVYVFAPVFDPSSNVSMLWRLPIFVSGLVASILLSQLLFTLSRSLYWGVQLMTGVGIFLGVVILMREYLRPNAAVGIGGSFIIAFLVYWLMQRVNSLDMYVWAVSRVRKETSTIRPIVLPIVSGFIYIVIILMCFSAAGILIILGLSISTIPDWYNGIFGSRVGTVCWWVSTMMGIVLAFHWMLMSLYRRSLGMVIRARILWAIVVACITGLLSVLVGIPRGLGLSIACMAVVISVYVLEKEHHTFRQR